MAALKSVSHEQPLFLGIEGGGTRTVALFADVSGKCLQRHEFGPANLRLLKDAQLLRLLRSIGAPFPRPDALAIGLAGARTATDRERIRSAAAKVWPRIPCHPTNDLETALAAAEMRSGACEGAAISSSRAKKKETREATVLILSGTGSCCYGRNQSGKTAKIGGWGHILGDQASAYDIALNSLKATLSQYDRDGVWPRLGRQFLQRLQLNEPNELIAWAQGAGKTEIAGLAVEVFVAGKKGDRIARAILAAAAASIARDAHVCAQRLTGPSGRVHFTLAGSVLLKQPLFARQVTGQLRRLRRGTTISLLNRESAWGAVMLAQNLWRAKDRGSTPSGISNFKFQISNGTAPLSPTERRNPRSSNLSKLSVDKAIALMLSEDARIPAAILAERKKIGQAVELIAHAFKHGGRLFYAGAGTSGRLGVLDASECPPTFRTPPELVQGIMAGGQTALWRSVEGAEDDPQAGVRAVEFRGVGRRDIVVGIAASGRTPFVWGALTEARRRGAKTILLAFNPHLDIRQAAKVGQASSLSSKISGAATGNKALSTKERALAIRDRQDACPTLVITPNVGPEILTGSTRLKAGSATKLILNIFTTLAMVRLGKVIGNLMVDLNPSNAKLRDRAVRIVQDLTRADYDTANTALEKSGWVIKKALVRLRGTKSR